MLALTDLEQVQEMLRRAASGDRLAQTWLCDPMNNPDAAAFFVFNFCMTQDEDRAGVVGPLPNPRGRGRFALEYLEAIDAPRLDPHNIHDEKPRRLLHTWLDCFYNLWALQWVRGYMSLLISRSEDHVDDGGRHERTFSMFSRMRFAYDRLPDHVRRPVTWQHMAASCPENEASVIGRAPTRDAGRGGGFVRAFVEECEHIEWMESIHVALDPACRMGKVYSDVVNGSANVVARIKKERREGWRFLEWDWWDDPAHADGIRDTVPGRERERYGQKISPWFVSATASLEDEDIAQEYLRDRQRSTKAICFYEYRRDAHVPEGRVRYNSVLPVWVGLDFGKTRKTAAVIGQPVGDRGLRVIGDFEGTHKTAPEIARALIAKVEEVAPGISPRDVRLIPDPSGLVGEQGTDVSLIHYYLAAGFHQYALPPVVGPGSVKLGIQIGNVAFMRREIEIDESCGILLEALPNYRWPVDRVTREVKRDADPLHGMESHVCDALRYLLTAVFRVDRKLYEPANRRFDDAEPVPIPLRKDDGRGFMNEERDAFRPIMGRARRF